MWLRIVFTVLSLGFATECSIAQTPYKKELTDADAESFSRLQALLPKVIENLQAEKFDAAVPIANDVYATIKKMWGDPHPELVVWSQRLAALFLKSDRYREALPFSEKHVAASKQVYGNEHPNTLAALNELAGLYDRVGDIEAAVKCARECAAGAEKTFPESDPRRAKSLNTLGYVLASAGEHQKARSAYEESLALHRAIFGRDHVETATTLANLGLEMQELGDLTNAIEMLTSSLTIFRKEYGDSHSATARTINSLGLCQLADGDFASARQNLENSLTIHQELLGASHLTTANVENNLAMLLVALGDYDAAKPHLEMALQIRQQVLGETHSDTAEIYNNLAFLEAERHDFKLAKGLYLKSLSIYEKSLGAEHAKTTKVLNNLGTTAYRLNELKTAEKYLQAALKNYQHIFGNKHPDVAMVLGNLGSVSEQTGDYALARDYFDRAIEIRLQISGSQHPDTLIVVQNRALLDARQGNWQQAIEGMDSERRGSQSQIARVLPSLSQREQLRFLNELDRESFQVAVQMGLLNRKDNESVRRSAEWLINGKAIAHEALAAQELLLRDARNPRLKKLAGELLAVRKQTAQLSMRTTAKQEDELVREQELARLSETDEKLTRQITQANGQELAPRAWVTFEEVQGTLADDQIMIEFVRFQSYDFDASDPTKKWGEQRYAAWVITNDAEPGVEIIDLGDAKVIDSLIENIRQQISDDAKPNGAIVRDGPDVALKKLNQPMRQLSRLIYEPFANQVKGKEHLSLSPDGNLWLVPWNCLPVGDDDQFLIERHRTDFLVSSRELMNRRATNVKPAASLIFANPEYDMAPKSVWDAIRSVLRDAVPDEQERQRSVSFSSKRSLPKVLPLPNTEIEATFVQPKLEAYSGRAVTVYKGMYAVESIVKSIERPRVALIATHGFFLPVDTEVASLDSQSSPTFRGNPLLRCGLMFAGCNDPNAGSGTAGDDGVLTGMEICGLDLRGTELIVLSACETGIGTVQNGEGVAGLRQAFQLAGAESVVATLWSIPDRDSAIIVNDLFSQLVDGKQPSDALREAQLKRIAARRERYGAAHPFFWAAFTITGDARVR